MPFDLRTYIGKNAFKALLLARRYPRGDTLSFFGGRPIMPEGMEWPIHPGTGRAMPFLAQIEVTRLIAASNPAVPAKGILYFFLDERLVEAPGTCSFVLYTPDVGSLSVRNPRADLPRIGDLDGQVTGGWAYDLSGDYNPFPIGRFPKYEISFFSFTDLQQPSDALGDVSAADRERLAVYAEAELDHALEQSWITGCFTKRQGRSYDSFHHHLLLDPDRVADTRFARQGTGPLSPIFEEWPQAWIFVGLHLMKFRASGRDASRFPDGKLKNDFLGECADWLRISTEKGAFTPLSPAERRRYREWLSTRYLSAMEAFATSKDQRERQSSLLIWSRLEDALRRSALDAITLCIDADQSNRTLLSEAALDDFAGGAYAHGWHQMFGIGETTNVYPAGEDEILLLQLATDYGMLWMFGDCGTLQIRIREDDLASQRFDRAKARIVNGD
jgi:uncharacterized protein YwqG